MAAAAIFNHALMAGHTAAKTAIPLDDSTSGTNGTSGSSGSSSSDDSATISANDFLTLLVTEMQNQDPTADTDPNEYINQLVQVNSLEQLIDINQTLSGDASGATSSSSASAASTGSTSATGKTNPVSGNQAAGVAPAVTPAGGSTTAEIMQALHVGGGTTPGSLGSLGQTGIAAAGSRAARAHGSAIAGNLAIEKTNPAAKRVGHALAGRNHAAAGTATPAAH